ncbi:MAG: hypothetical protein IPH07_27155 [Deltaproteobacteria bacterium]|nr:hypothetical protein [Deltaproteobacteria bacterium]MBK8714572.1 hypothetical protein [Deltaproteobacteria bacterium]MBP7290047.1 hypothetical protein [Nannocystaceae bacterium]
MVQVLLACGPATRCPPVQPNEGSELAGNQPSVHDTGEVGGQAWIVVTDTDTRRRLPNRRVTVECGRFSIELATDRRGTVEIRGLPNEPCLSTVFDALDEHSSKAWMVAPGEVAWIAHREVGTPEIAERLPADALPDDVVLERRSSGCLGPCRSYHLTLRLDGRVELARDLHRRNLDGTRFRRWRLPAAATQRAVAQARCLANGPSYGAHPTDVVMRTLEVRDGDAIARYEHYAYDRRMPEENARRLRRLDQTLLLPPGAWSPSPAGIRRSRWRGRHRSRRPRPLRYTDSGVAHPRAKRASDARAAHAGVRAGSLTPHSRARDFFHPPAAAVRHGPTHARTTSRGRGGAWAPGRLLSRQ